MIYFLHGEDSYRSKKKLSEIIDAYKSAHKSGLSLLHFDASQKSFSDLANSLRSNSIFQEKKLAIIKNGFSNTDFQDDFLKQAQKMQDSKDIIIIYEAQKADQRTKFFKALRKTAKSQEFSFLTGANLKKWAAAEFAKYGAKISPTVLDAFLARAGNDLWLLANEIKKLADFKKGRQIQAADIELHLKPAVQSDIFKTIQAISQKDRKLALHLLHRHLEAGDNGLYLLSMIAYQFRNLLIIKDLQEKNIANFAIAKRSGLHPFVVQKTGYLCGQFSMEQLKKIYRKIFQIDCDVKTGKAEIETAIDLLVAQI